MSLKQNDIYNEQQEENKMNHTPTPWKVKQLSLYQGHDGPKILISSESGLISACRNDAWDKEENEANAAFIVTACNAHEDLVKALEVAREWLGSNCSGRGLISAQAMADRALAKARVKL